MYLTLQKIRCELFLSQDQPALVIFDRFKAQCTEKILSLLDKNNIRIAVVPANCTDRLQPLDVSVNRSAKEYLRNQFQNWYSEQVCKQLKEKMQAKSIDLSLSVAKPLGLPSKNFFNLVCALITNSLYSFSHFSFSFYNAMQLL